MLQDQGGKCAGCGETKPLSEVDGHHKQRHADGGPTTKKMVLHFAKTVIKKYMRKRSRLNE